MLSVLKMGLFVSKAIRYSRRFNIENRAHRVTEMDKLPLAPHYKNFEMEIKKAQELGFDERIHLKHQQLDSNLKDVYLKSFDENPEFPSDKKRIKVSREKFVSTDPFVSHKEPDVIPEGKCTVKQALKFLTEHGASPYLYDSKRIAEEYKLPEEVTRNILKYFSALELFEPVRLTVGKAAKPVTNRKQIKERLTKKLVSK